MKYFVLLSAICVLQSVSAEPFPLKPETVEWMNEMVPEIMRKKKIVGLSVAIVHKDGTIFQNAYGYAQKSTGRKATTETAFGAGSISKVLTATAIMKLHQEGRLNIDDPITKYVPEFSLQTVHPDPDYSLRSFLIHKSGIGADYLRGVIGPSPMSLDELVIALQDEYQAAPSNTVHCYTNLGYDMLGVVIERVTGMSYTAYLQQLLDEMGMNQSSFDINHPNVKERMAKGYFKSKQEWDYVNTREVPAGGLLTTVEDLGKFTRMMMNEGETDNGQFFQKETIEVMWAPQNGGVPLDFSFVQGLGWKLSGVARINTPKSVPIRWHSGSTSLFCAQMLIMPEQDFAIVALENSQRKCGTLKNIVHDIALRILEEQFGIPPEEERTFARLQQPSEEDLVNMPGHYATQFGWLKVHKKGNQLRATLINKKFKLLPYEDGRFGLRLVLAGIPIKIGALDNIRWKHEKAGEQEVLVFSEGRDKYFFGIKFNPEPNADVWQTRLGKYELMNLGDDIRILYNMQLKKKGNLYYLQFIPKLYEKYALQMPLKTYNNTLALVRGYGRYLGDAVRFEETAEGTVMHYMGYKWKLKR